MYITSIPLQLLSSWISIVYRTWMSCYQRLRWCVIWFVGCWVCTTDVYHRGIAIQHMLYIYEVALFKSKRIAKRTSPKLVREEKLCYFTSTLRGGLWWRPYISEKAILQLQIRFLCYPNCFVMLLQVCLVLYLLFYMLISCLLHLCIYKSTCLNSTMLSNGYLSYMLQTLHST
jgi:hypothetical protein